MTNEDAFQRNDTCKVVDRQNPMVTNKEDILIPEEEIVKLAGTWQIQKTGRQRESDGTVPGWHFFAKSHHQKDDEIVICRGREEWKHQLLLLLAHDASRQQPLFSVVSWNVLSDTWWQKQRAVGAYSHTPQEEGDWAFRFHVLLQWMENLNPDILALQEVDYEKFYADLQPALQARGYTGLMQTPKKRASGQPCWVATFWKSTKFQIEQEASFSRSLCVILDILQDTSSSQHDSRRHRVCITNVHLEASQSEVGSERRARQLNSALAFAAQEAPSAALLLCGDCNTGADSQLFRVLREYEWHGHKMSSVYEHPSTHKTLPVSKATFMVPNHHYAIDHMFYGQDSLRLCCALDAFSATEMDEHVHSKGELLCGFPSAFCPSDHIPIGGIFEVLPQDNIVIDKKSPATPVLSLERQAELLRQWEVLQSQRPAHTKGKPTPEQLSERRIYKASIQTWKEKVKGNPLEQEFIARMIKSKK